MHWSLYIGYLFSSTFFKIFQLYLASLHHLYLCSFFGKKKNKTKQKKPHYILVLKRKLKIIMIFTNLHQHLVSIELKQIDHEIFLKNKISLCTICRELQFEVCNHGKHASPCTAREGECFHRKEKEVGRAIKNRVHDALLHESVPGKKRSFFIPIRLCYHHRAWKLPFLVTNSK